MASRLKPPRPHLASLVFDALLRPGRLTAYTVGTSDATRWVTLLCVEVLIATMGLLVVLEAFIPLGVVALIGGPLMALCLAVMLYIPLFFTLSLKYSLRASIVLSLARALVALWPPAALGLTLVFSTAFPDLRQNPLVVIALLITVGAWVGDPLIVSLLVSTRRSEAPALRWLGVVAAILLSALIWWSEPLRLMDGVVFLMLLVGLGLGLLRPLSYSWEAPLSAALALAARLGVPSHRLRAFHPVSLDELVLIPLPGLAALLVRACKQDIATGGPWLIEVAQHPSQAQAARRALERLVVSGQGHIVLFWLSTDDEGAAWLRQVAARTPRPHPLIAAYATLSAVDDPAAWPVAIAAHRQAFIEAARHPGGAALQAFLELGAQTLAADRWVGAMAALRHAPPHQALGSDQLCAALLTMRAWSDNELPALFHERALALAKLWDSLDQLDGWPARLLDAAAEHLVYLLLVEHRRGAWIV